MILYKYRKYILVLGVITATIGLLIRDNYGLPFVIFGCYWSGLSMGLIYMRDNEIRSRP